MFTSILFILLGYRRCPGEGHFLSFPCRSQRETRRHPQICPRWVAYERQLRRQQPVQTPEICHRLVDGSENFSGHSSPDA